MIDMLHALRDPRSQSDRPPLSRARRKGLAVATFALALFAIAAPRTLAQESGYEAAPYGDAANAATPVDEPASTEGNEAASSETEPTPELPAEAAPEETVATEPPQDPPPPSAVAEGLLPDGSLDPCATDLRSRPVGPLSVGELDGQLGVPYRACPRNEVAIGGDALLVADTAHFYGNIRASGRVRASVLLDPNVEGFVSWEALRYQTVISSVSAAYLGLGYLTTGVTARVFSEKGRVYAITGRVVLPTTSGLDQSSQPLALDVGLTGAWQADRNFRFHMWLTLLGSIGLGGPAEPHAGLRVGGGVDWRPYEWISFVLELQSGFLYRDLLDLMALNAGVRLALGSDVGLELAASVPFLGVRALDDGATALAATLMLSWRFR